MKKLTIKKLITISRPRFWIYSLGPFLIGIIATYDTISAENLIPLIVFGIFFLTIGNLYIYGINDIFDYETDLKNPKKQGYEFLVTPFIWKPLGIIITLTTLPFFAFLFLTNNLALYAFLSFLFFAGQYSAPPLRAKTKPVLDSFMSAGHYIAGGLMGYYIAGGETFPLLGIIAGISWAMAMHAYSAIPDIQADTDSGIQTIATFFGKDATLIICTLLYILSATIGAVVLTPFLLIGVIPYLLLMYKSYTQKNIFSLYKYFPYLNLVAGFSLFWVVFLF